MDLNLTPEELAFQNEVRGFLRANIPPATKRKVDLGLKLVKDDYVVWQRILHERGWIAPSWPKEYGCRVSWPARIGGARAFPNRGRAPTWRP